MTNKQSDRLEKLARLDELDRLNDKITDPEAKTIIAEQKKALREALDKPLST